MSSKNVYLKEFQTFTDTAVTDKVKIYYRIEYFNHMTLNKLVLAPDVANKATGNITLVYELVPNATVPDGTTVTEEFVDAHFTADWHTFPQPHKISLVLIHNRGSDEGSMNTSDPN
jgi:hypothetical protein